MSVYYKLGLFLIFILSIRLFYTRAAPSANSNSHNYTNEDYPDEFDYDYEDDEITEATSPNSQIKTTATTTRSSKNPITLSFIPTIELPKRSNHVLEPSCPKACKCLNDFKNVNCNNTGLTQVPSDLPSTVITLDLSHNHLTTLRPNDLINCTKLRELNLNHNQLSELQEQMFVGPKRLQNLRLANNRLTHLQPDFFTAFSSLQLLELSNNNIELPENAVFLNQPNLLELYCSNCSWTQLYNETFANLSNLQALKLDKNDFKKKINTKAFAPLTNLIKLKLPDLEKSYIRELCNELHVIDTISFNHFNISCFVLVSDQNDSFDDSLTAFTESSFQVPESHTLATAAQQNSNHNSNNMTDANFVLLDTNKTAPSNGIDVQNVTVLQAGISAPSNSTESEEETYKVPISSEAIKILLISIMISALIGIIIGVLCRKDVGGIKTKCCRTRKPTPKNSTQQTAEEIPLK